MLNCAVVAVRWSRRHRQTGKTRKFPLQWRGESKQKIGKKCILFNIIKYFQMFPELFLKKQF